MFKNKPFNKRLYEKYDELAKKYAKSILAKVGLDVRDNDDKMGVDLIATNKRNESFNVEVEIKTYIRPDGTFAFDTLHILHRKLKYCNLRLPTLFMLFSKCGKSYFCVWDKYITSSPIKEVHNIYVSKDEMFFDVNIKKYVDDSIEKALKRKWRN